MTAFELGSAYTRQEPLTRVTRPLLARLVDQTGHNAHLAVLHGRDVLYLVEERAPGRPPLVTDVGVRLPASLTASGLALLAALSRPQVRALYPTRAEFVRRHGLGPTTPAELRSLLVDVRRAGYASENGSVTPQFASVAAAAYDHTGHPVAGVAVTFPAADVPREAWPALAARVVATAGLVTRRIGGSPPR